MSLKTYVLKSHTNATAPIYQRVNNEQRVRLEKRPIDHAFLKLTFYSEETKKNRTARYKASSDSIWQDEQIKEGIPANESFTTAERNAVKFKNGVLMTDNETLQKYLETIPQCDGFKGMCDSVKEPLYEVYDKTIKVKSDNQEFLKRLDAASKIAAIYKAKDVKAGQDLMIRLNGSFYKAPDDPDDILAELTRYIDDADEIGLDKLLDDSMTQDEALVILVGKAVAADLISFDQSPNQVSLKKNNNWVDVKMISSNLPAPERQRVFVEFLASPDGKYLADDLKIKIEGDKKKKKETVNA